MKRITEKQRKELDDKLSDLVKKHPRKYKGAELHYGDLGYSVCLLAERKYGSWKGKDTVFHFMCFESMWNVLHYATYSN